MKTLMIERMDTNSNHALTYHAASVASSCAARMKSETSGAVAVIK